MKENYDYDTVLTNTDNREIASWVSLYDDFIAFVDVKGARNEVLTVLEYIEINNDKIFKVGHYNLHAFNNSWTTFKPGHGA